MNILYLSYERDIDLEKNHNVYYLDCTMKMVDGKYPKQVFDGIMNLNPDVVIEREFNDKKAMYVDIIRFIAKNLPNCKRAVWLIDNHCNFEWHKQYAPLFDYAFVAISKFRPMLYSHLRNLGCETKVFWLPVCYPYRMDKIIRNKSHVPFEIVFVGRWDGYFKRRTNLIHKLQENYGERFFPITDYSNMEDYLRQGIISFNCSLQDDMNFRVFESMANGVELVTDDVPDLHLIHGLVDRINIYKKDEDLIKLIDSILDMRRENDVIRTQIWVQNHHCLVNRHKEILEMINTNVQHKY
jgi:glycosyltransferase involved in cell wall biosynthesis